MLAIIKKEMKKYFLSPVGYVVIAIFMLVFNIFFIMTTVNNGKVDLGNLYYYVSMIGLIFIVPVLTMRLFSEERKQGTEQLLLTSPISIIKIILAKFISASLVIVVTLVISLIYYLILCFFGTPNFELTMLQIIGFLLVSMGSIAFGMFISSLTENQIISALITILYLAGMFYLMSKMGATLKIIPLFYLPVFYMRSASGIIAMSDILVLLLYTITFITLTWIVMKRRKLVR